MSQEYGISQRLLACFWVGLFTLTAHSDGPGRGATFTLQLPINTTET